MPTGNSSVVSFSDAALRKEVVEAAIRAPSGDNCQPWRFRFERDRVEIYMLPDRAQSFFDFRNRGTYLSIGAVVENIRVRVACSDLALIAHYPAGEPAPGMPTVSGSLRPGIVADGARARLAALHERTVNRRPFLPKRIAPEKQKAWLADQVDGTAIAIIESRREIARWARVVYLGDRIRWTHPTIHNELFSKILFSRAEADSKRAGLEIDRLGAGPFAASLMHWLQPWSRMERLARCGVDRVLANQTRSLAFCAGALVLVTIERDEPEQWIRAGEQVQRLWTTAHQQGLCVQPLPIAMYLDQRFQKEGAEHFPPAHRPLLEQMRGDLALLIGNRVGAMLYRVGLGLRMSRPAVRLPAESFYDDLVVAP